jgi:hypothetical protein
VNLNSPDSPIQCNGSPGLRSQAPNQTILLGTVYESLVSLACSSFRDNSVISFPYGGSPLDPSPLYALSHSHSGSCSSTPRVDTLIDIFKIIYVLKASSSSSAQDPSTSSFLTPDSFPQPSAYPHLQSLPYLPLPVLDFSLHVLLVEIMLLPQPLIYQPLYDLQLHTLQLFSVMVPHPDTFTLILRQIYSLSLSPFPSPVASASASAVSQKEVEAMKRALLPLCQSLLRILSIQLIQVSHLFKSPSGETQSIAAKIVPILVALSHTHPPLTISPVRRCWNNLLPRVLLLEKSSSLSLSIRQTLSLLPLLLSLPRLKP